MAKTPHEHLAEFEAGVERFDRLIPKNADELTVVLKGHLLVEEQLRMIIRSLVANPQYIDKARLTFVNALFLARAVAGHFNNGLCWVAAEKLNALRNQLAHQAEPSTTKELFAPFFDVCESESAWFNIHDMPRDTFKLRNYIAYMWITFDVLKSVVQISVQTVPSPLTIQRHYGNKS